MPEPLVYTLLNTSKKIKRMIQKIDNSNDQVPYELLGFLDKNGKTLKQLTDLMNCSKQEVSRQVKRAEKNQWIELAIDENDKRSKKVIIATKGINAIKIGASLYNDIEEEWIKKIGKNKINQLSSILNEINKSL